MLYNLEAEKAVLGGLLMDNKLIKKTLGKLKPEFFYFPNHKALFEGILKAYEQHGCADIPTLSEFDIEFIVEVMNCHVTAENWKQHCKIIANLNVRREIVKASEEIKTIAQNHDIEDIEMLKAESVAALNNVNLPEQKSSVVKIHDIALQALSSLEKKYMQGEASYLSWKMKWLQEKTGGIRPEYTILAARPSIGKTAFALQAALKVAIQGAKVAIFSLEMVSESLFARLLSNYANIEKDYFDKPYTLDDKKWIEISMQSARLAQLPIKIYDNVFTIEEILLKCEEAKANDGLDFVVIDYIQLIETMKKTNNTNDRIAYISRTLKKLQQKNNLHVLALSQFNREAENQEWPSLKNLRDSGSLEQDANNVFMLHQVQDKNQEQEPLVNDIWLIIAKQREGERNIKTKLKFVGKTQRFYDN